LTNFPGKASKPLAGAIRDCQGMIGDFPGRHEAEVLGASPEIEPPPNKGVSRLSGGLC